MPGDLLQGRMDNACFREADREIVQILKHLEQAFKRANVLAHLLGDMGLRVSEVTSRFPGGLQGAFEEKDSSKVLESERRHILQSPIGAYHPSTATPPPWEKLEDR